MNIINTNFLKELEGCKLTNLIYQPTKDILSDENMFVFNFTKKGKNFSLHVFTFVRIRKKGFIYLTSSDEFFDEIYNKLEKNSDSFLDNTLLNKEIEFLNANHENKIVEKIVFKTCGDLKIYFIDQTVLEIIIDCQYQGYEYFRLIDLDTNNNFIAYFEDGEIKYDIKWK